MASMSHLFSIDNTILKTELSTQQGQRNICNLKPNAPGAHWGMYPEVCSSLGRPWVRGAHRCSRLCGLQGICSGLHTSWESPHNLILKRRNAHELRVQGYWSISISSAYEALQEVSFLNFTFCSCLMENRTVILSGAAGISPNSHLSSKALLEFWTHHLNKALMESWKVISPVISARSATESLTG